MIRKRVKLPPLSTADGGGETGGGGAAVVSSRGRLSLRGQKMLLLLAGVLLISLPVMLLFLQSARQLQGSAQKQAALAAELLAAVIRQWVDNRLATADFIAEDPQLARVLQDGTEPERAARARELAYLFPTSIGVRLLPPGIQEVDLQTSPPISYAALDMLRHAETRDSPPPVEVHMSGTPQQHVTLVRRIVDAAGRHIVGHLMVSYPVQQLQDALGAAQVGGYAQLQQVAAGTPLVLGSRGIAAAQSGTPTAWAAVPGTRWRVAYWEPASASVGASGAAALTLAAVAVFATLVLSVFYRIRSALNADRDTLLEIVEDMRAGRVQAAYPHSLIEMHDAVEAMARTALSATAPHTPAATAGQVAGQPSPGPEAVDGEGDLLFDDSGLDIARIEVQHSEIDASIFRAYDIRGVVGDTLTARVAHELGRAIGSEAYYRGEQTVVVGRDGRLSTPELADALIEGLKASGRDVWDVGQVPTPVLYFAAHHLGTRSGVMVTGSHNPPEYNGFKIMLGGETLAGDAIRALHQRVQSGDLLTGEGSLKRVEVLADYIHRVKADIQIARPVKVVVDCGNGVAAEAAPRLLQALGCEVIELYCEVDGSFPNHHPDPSRAENLADLRHVVLQHGAELGIAFDGDGDRLGVIGSRGEIIRPDRLLMLLSMDVLSRNPGGQVIYDVKCSRHVAEVVAQFGGEPLMTATGHSLIKAKMKETGALLAGEMSGHIFFKERWFGFDDGLYAAARLVEILANDHRTSSDIFAALPDSVATPELTIPMAEGEPQHFMEKLLASARFDDASVITIDGMRVEFDEGWGLVRASNTTPCLTLRFEANDAAALNRIQAAFRRVMLQVDSRLSLPF